MTTKSNALSIIITTCPDQKTADILIKKLITEQLAACIQQTAITSDYRWEGKHESTCEIKLEIKTLDSLFDKVSNCIRNNHPYECPEIISVAVNHSTDQYAEWILKSVKAAE